MEIILLLGIAALLLAGLFRLMLLPLRLGWKLLVNGLCGLLSLWLVNLTAGLTGFSIPINPITALIAGSLGIPGLALLGLLQWLL